jgi:uncharacterized membrane protein YdbT with pleckstrin-like domain
MAAPASPAASAPEKTLWKGSPSPILLAGYVIAIVVTLVAIPALSHFFASTMPDATRAGRLTTAGWIIAGALTLIEALAFLVAWVKLRSTSYTITNQRVQIEQGIFSKTVDEIDLRYVDDSSFTQGLLDRILGIGNVTLVSSDKTTPRYVLRSVRDPRGVREMIRTEAYQVSQRQVFTRAT